MRTLTLSLVAAALLALVPTTHAQQAVAARKVLIAATAQKAAELKAKLNSPAMQRFNAWKASVANKAGRSSAQGIASRKKPFGPKVAAAIRAAAEQRKAQQPTGAVKSPSGRTSVTGSGKLVKPRSTGPAATPSARPR